MPPKTHNMALLFHPKKKKNDKVPPPPQNGGPSNSVNGSSQPPGPNPTSPQKRRPPPKKADDDEELQLPEGTFQEFKLLSSALNGWKYDVMKFDSRKPVDVFKWQGPVKLNRKDLRRNDEAAAVVPQAVGPMLGPDGKPVIGADGRMVMVDAEGRPIHNNVNGAASGSGSKDKDKGKAAAKKRFQKKTKQIYPIAESVRQLRREERYPWVIEDSSPTQNELWIGHLDDVGKAGTYAFFMPAANDVFKFVPSHRWYKFQKKMKHDLPTDTANVENLYNLSQKRDPQQWLAQRKGKGPSSATAAMFKAEAEGRTITVGNSLVHSSGQSLGPGGRKLKTVDSGMDHLFEDDEDGEGAERRRARELGEEGGMDEQVYEEDFADDDEHMEVDDNDEEAKEAEERLKKEYQAANKQGETGVDESEDEEMPGASKQEKAMQKLIRNREGNDAYESDEDKNPYASSEEEEPEEVVTQTAASAIMEQQQKVESKIQPPKVITSRPDAPTTGQEMRAGSPLSPGGGHSVVAKRATSPKVPKPKGSSISRGNSPLGGQPTVPGSRSTSPAASAGAGTNGDTSGKANLKRKADDTPNTAIASASANAPKQKKRKAPALTGAVVSSAELESMLLEWLKMTSNATTRDCIQHFTPYLVDDKKKSEFSAMVRKHASLKNGVLVVRSASKGGSSAPSPVA